MKMALTFFMVFVVGPILFWQLARPAPSRHRIAGLMLLAIALMITAFAAGTWLVPALTPSPYPGLLTIVTSWLSWIVVLAYAVMALKFRITSNTPRKAILAIGAMATTLPWFGLYAAQMMAEE